MNNFPLIVLDASAALALLLSEAQGEEVETLIRDTLDNNGQIFVPELFWYELGNSMVSAERGSRITVAESAESVAAFSRLPIVSHAIADNAGRSRAADLARSHRLTFYDASYLELALRFGARLKSFDTHLLLLKDTYSLII